LTVNRKSHTYCLVSYWFAWICFVITINSHNNFVAKRQIHVFRLRSILNPHIIQWRRHDNQINEIRNLFRVELFFVNWISIVAPTSNHRKLISELSFIFLPHSHLPWKQTALICNRSPHFEYSNKSIWFPY
jgi:hypothetical protein